MLMSGREYKCLSEFFSSVKKMHWTVQKEYVLRVIVGKGIDGKNVEIV